MERGVGEEGILGQVWKVFGCEQFLRGMWEYFALKSAWARKILADAAQEGMPGQWQYESPSKEVLEQAKRSADTDCGPHTMRRAYSAMKLGNSESLEEECRKEGKFCAWTFEFRRLMRRWQWMISAA